MSASRRQHEVERRSDDACDHSDWQANAEREPGAGPMTRSRVAAFFSCIVTSPFDDCPTSSTK
jgi:hypothetical protein